MDELEERIRRAVDELGPEGWPEGWFTTVRTTEAGDREVGLGRYVSEASDETIEVYLVSTNGDVRYPEQAREHGLVELAERLAKVVAEVARQQRVREVAQELKPQGWEDFGVEKAELGDWEVSYLRLADPETGEMLTVVLASTEGEVLFPDKAREHGLLEVAQRLAERLGALGLKLPPKPMPDLTRLKPNPTRDALVRKLWAQGFPRRHGRYYEPLPVVSLEDFFVGEYGDMGIIAPNLSPPPDCADWYAYLREVRARPDVQDVLVEIEPLYLDEDGQIMGDDFWPQGTVIYVLTSAPEQAAEEWSERLRASLPLEEGWRFEPPRAAPPLREGYRIWRLWWD